MEATISVIRIPSLLLCLGVVTLSPMFAQTTPTERAAVREIVQEIEVLQARLNPTEMGQRLANRNDRDRNDILARVEELTYALAESMGAPELNREPQRPAGYEERGFVSHDIPGVSVSVFSSAAAGHSYERFEDSMKPVGH